MTRQIQSGTEPVYTHDCKACLYLGADFARHGETPVNQVDNYIHLNPSGAHTIIRRFSSTPADYISFKPSHLDRHYVPPGYISAVNLAKAKGLL